jgi:hypothetical protein
MALRSRIDLPKTFDNGTFARLVPFGDKREVIVRRGTELGGSYGLEQGRRVVTLGGVEVAIVRYHDLLSPPPLTAGMPPISDDSNYRPVRDVVYLPDAEVLVDRGPTGFSDAELELILAAIIVLDA